MFEIFEYGFMVRALEAGALIAIIAPLIGIFLVLRRYSLLADTLAHVSLSGIAIGLLANTNPLITALAASGVAAAAMERLRASRRVYGETALSLFLSGSLGLAVVLFGLARGLNANLVTYLFGSIVTVRPNDLIIMSVLGAIIIALVAMFYRELVCISFDEETARVAGIPVGRLNMLLVIVAALAIVLAIPTVGVLLVSALMVIPVAAALQLKKGFTKTLLYAELFSLSATIAGLIISFYLNLSPGGAIVLILLGIFGAVALFKKFSASV